MPRPTAGLAAVCLGIAASVLPGFLLGTLFVEMGPDLGYDEATSGMLVASFFAASVALSAGLGRWVDRRPPTASLRVALAASAALQLAIALGGHRVGIVALLALGAGAANALNQISANVWIARQVPVARQGIAFAAKQSSMPAAALVAGASLPALVSRAGWRSAFVVGAVLSLVALVGLGRDRTSVRPAARRHPAPAAAPPPTGPALVALAVGTALASGAAVTLGSFFVNSATDAGMGAGVAGALLALGSAVSIMARFVAGSIADRRPGPLLGMVQGMLGLGAVAYLTLVVRAPWAHVVALPLAFGAGWAWPGVFNLSVVRAVPRAPGRATGITQTGTYVGATVGPLAFGLLAERVGYGAAWSTAALLAVAAVVAIGVARPLLAGSGPDHVGTPYVGARHGSDGALRRPRRRWR